MNRHMHIHEHEMASRSSIDKKKVKSTDSNQKSKALEEEKKDKPPVCKESAKASVNSKRLKTIIKQETEEVGEDDKCTEIPDHQIVKASPGCSRENAVKVSEQENAVKVSGQPNVESEAQTNNSLNPDAKIVTGFEDLVYMAFSSPNFCLVAKKACEETIRLPHASECNYKCQTCEKIFPCAIALKKHEAFHQSSRRSDCHDCGCHFAFPQNLKEHMLKYHTPLKKNGEIGYAGFMAALGLHHKPKMLPPEPAFHVNKEPGRNESESPIYSSVYDRSKIYTRPGWLAGNFSCYNQVENSTEIVNHKDTASNMEVEKSLEPTAKNNIWQQEKESTIEKDATPCPSTKCLPIQVNITQNSQQESSNDFADITSIISNVAAAPGTSSESTEFSESLHIESGSEADTCSIKSYAKNSKKKGSKSGFKQLHPCSLCDYKSTEKSSLMRHMLTHDKERPFKCTLCEMTFTTKSNGERHAKTIHKLPKQELTSVIDYNLKVSTSDGKVKTCKYCDKMFENNRGLQHHLRSVTSSCSQKPFICGKCKRGCSTKNNCIRHFQNAHKDLLDELSSDKAKGRKLQDFIIVNKHKKIREQQRKLFAANENEASASNGDSSNSETSGSESPSPMPQQSMEQQCSFNDDDRVINAAECLVSLAEGLDLSMGFKNMPQEQVIEDSPLDLSVRAMDLSERKNLEMLQRQNAGHSASENSTSFNGTFNFSALSPSNPTATDELIDYSNFSTPLNLTKKESISSDNLSMSPIEGNTSTPINYLSVANCESFPSTSKDNCVTPVPYLKISKSETQHVCNYCDSKFTQKSNKDRHIRNFHPEHAKPRRNKNFAMSINSRSTSKHASSTLSSATREAILTRVLQHNDSNKPSQIENNHSMDIVIKDEPNQVEEGINSDLENVDLASVSSVIHTANSPTFTPYHTEDDKNSYSQSAGEKSADGPPQKKFKTSKSDNEKSLSCDFPLCDKTFNCKSSLKRHSVIHTGERAYECQYCSKQFTTNSNMVRHITNKHKTSSSQKVIPSTTRQSLWHTPSTSEGPINLSGSSDFVLHEAGLKVKQNLGELCVSPATRREYPEPNHSPTLPETSQAAMPFVESQSLECTFCSTTYKTEADRWNHVKQLHPLEYERMHGKDVNLPDIMSLWKKNGCAKLKR